MDRKVFDYAYLAGLVVAPVFRLYAARSRGRKTSADRQQAADTVLLALTPAGMLLLPLLSIFTPWLNFADHSVCPVCGMAGIAIFATSLLLLWRSHADLGANWSPTLRLQEEQALVTRGVYRWIRHPMYSAYILWGIAQSLLIQNWIAGFSMLAFMVPLFLVRIPAEERMMLERFGEEYRRYMEQTGGLFPHF